MEVVLGDLKYPIVETIIFFILILSLIFNTFLFRRGEGNYSIKYQLMRNQLFFRQNMFFTYLIEGIYKFFFLLPFLLLFALTVLAAIRDTKNIPPILINGLIILLIMYPTKTLHFYYKLFAIWLLVIGSQLSTLFIYEQFGDQAYLILSTIFYTGNVLFFYLALVSIENVYWQVSEGFTQNLDELTKINQQWVKNYLENQHQRLDSKQKEQDHQKFDEKVRNKLKQKSKQALDKLNNFVGNQAGESEQNIYVQNNKIPKIFDGGLYGFFTKNRKYRYLQYIILYLISLIFLGIYAYLVHRMLDSNLGIVGLVSAVIYDIFIQIFNVLDNEGRSLKTVYVVLVISRFFSFVFGIQNWILGYCVLYFGISIFIGWIIIQKRFPLRMNQNKKRVKQTLNAFRTPEFVLLVLTVQIVVMLLVEAYALDTQDPTLNYNNVTIPIWQWGVLAVIAAWVIIIYLLSVRVLTRHRFKIYELTQYYFGIARITEYHVYVLTSYLLLIAIGLYAMLYLHEKIVLTCCIFLPLLYLCLLDIRVSWTKNQYKILADTDEYNLRMEKKRQVQEKKKEKFKNKDKKQQYMKNTRLLRSDGINMIDSYKKLVNTSLKQVPQILKQKKDAVQQSQQNSNVDFNPNPTLSIHKITPQTMIPQKSAITPSNALVNWRKQDVKLLDIWSCLTPHDKKIILSTIMFILLFVGFCIMSMLWANSKFAISFMVCIFSYLTLYVYVKYYKTKQDFRFYHAIISWLGFILGIVYWSVFHDEVIGPIAFSLAYIILSIFVLIKCYQMSVVPLILVSLIAQILLCITFIQIILAVHKTVVQASIFGIIFFIIVVLQVPLYFKLTRDHIPKLVIILTSIPIGIVVIVVSIFGYVKHILSSFAIFTIVLFLVFIAFFSTALALYLLKKKHNEQNPNIYSAYGEPYYRFQSGKQVMKYNIDHVIVFSFAMITIVVYSVIVSIFFVEKEWAVFGLSIFWIMHFFVNLQAAMSSYLFIGQYKKKKLLTNQIIVQSFKKLNNNYMAQEVQGQPSSFYGQKLKLARQKANQDGKAEDWEEVVKYHDLFSKNLKQQERFLFFWTGLIMFNLMSKQRQNINQTLAQLKQIEDELGQFGIVIQSLNLALSPKQKYDKVIKQIQNLQPVQYILYEETLKQHRIQMAKKKKQSEEMHKKQKEQNQKRQQQLFDEIKRQESLKQQDPIEKFNSIIKNIKSKKFYEDKEFPADSSVLGEQLEKLVPMWRRPGVHQVFSKQGINAADVKQGQIGDCYLLSSFAVLGEQRINSALGYDEEQKKWKWVNEPEKGVYMVRFYKFSKEKYVIIDDMLPSNESQQWVFAKSQDPIQYWPCILEKAYAKLYGGYNKIIEGKCSQVLAEFTNGFPTEIQLGQYKSNPYGLWSRILSSKKNRYLMAAGSPPNPRGDAAFSKRGIVQGHAYSILDAQEQDQYKLIKLKNPHGSQGRQWIGDFSDKSDFLTKVMMQKLGHTRAKDGIFWMTIQDFIMEFKSLYICAIFDKEWKKLGPYQGQWTDNNSFGLPNQIGAENNPHYGIKVTKKCTLFLSLTQENKTALKGKNFIFMKTLRNNGKRITASSVSSQNSVGKSKTVTNAVTISEQLQLQANQYPYTFSLMLCCKQPGNTGKYTLLAYCDDKLAEVIIDEDFDRKK